MLPPNGFFTINYVPEFASETAKKIEQIFNLLKEEAKAERWAGITPENFTIEYDTSIGDFYTSISYVDTNKHQHRFGLSFIDIHSVPPLTVVNEFGEFVSDSFCCVYFFEGAFDDDMKFVKSFASHIATCLPDNIKRVETIHNGWGLEIHVCLDAVYDTFCTLIDTVIANIKPMEWFYEAENLKTQIGTHNALYEDKLLSKFLRNLIVKQNSFRSIIKTYLRGGEFSQTQSKHMYYISYYGKSKDGKFHHMQFGKHYMPISFTYYESSSYEGKERYDNQNKKFINLAQSYLSSHKDVVDMKQFRIIKGGFSIYFLRDDTICDKHLRIFCGLLTILIPYLRGD